MTISVGRTIIAIVSMAMIASVQAIAAARGDVRRAAEGYATAVCLTAQNSAFLKDQGDGWAANIVQRAAFSLVSFGKLARIVKAEMARVPMAGIIVESPPMTTKTLPVQYCAEIIDATNVRTAIETIVKGRASHR